MIILQIKTVDFVVVDFERDPPVARNRNAPRSGAVAGKLVDAPAGRTFHPLDVLDAQQGGKNAPDPIDQIAPDAPVVVIFDKAFQPSMPDSPNPHAFKCTVKPYYRQASLFETAPYR